MKLSKTSWIVLTVGISIIAFASLGFARAQQLHERNQLNEELSIAELRLSKFQIEQFSSQQEELEKQLTESIAQLETTKVILSQPAESIAVSGTLFNIAETCGVEITEISSSGLSSSDLEGITCSVLPLTVKAEGVISSLMSFIFTLNGDFITGTVETVSISVGVSENATEEGSSANIRLLIYAYKGD